MFDEFSADVDFYVNGGLRQPGCALPSITNIKSILDLAYYPVESKLTYIHKYSQLHCSQWIFDIQSCLLSGRFTFDFHLYLNINLSWSISLLNWLNVTMASSKLPYHFLFLIFYFFFTHTGYHTCKYYKHPKICQTSKVFNFCNHLKIYFFLNCKKINMFLSYCAGT